MCYLVRIDDVGEVIVFHIIKKIFKITQAPLVPCPSEVGAHAAPASICTPYQIGTLPILRLRLRRERKAGTKGKKRGRGRGERWRWSNVAEQLFCTRNGEVHTPQTTTWGVVHGGRRRRYPTCWTSTSGANYKVEGLQPKEWR